MSDRPIVTTRRRGHVIVWEFDRQRWLWEDTGQPADWERPCAACGAPQTPEGHDPCLGTLQGVTGACCGHGYPEDSYVLFDDGRAFYGEEVRLCLTQGNE